MILDKDDTIKQLLIHLEQTFGQGKLVVTDFWDSDLCAIGLSDSKKERLVYISSWKKKQGEFFVSKGKIVVPSVSFDERDNINIQQVEGIVKNYLLIK